MLQECLNAVMVMHVHPELMDSFDWKSVANEFRLRSDHRN